MKTFLRCLILAAALIVGVGANAQAPRDAGPNGSPKDGTGTTCQVSIAGEDSYGDGWNGGFITVYQNDIAIDTFTVTGSSNTEYFTVSSDYPVLFEWTAGSYASEVSFSIYDGGGAATYVCTNASTLSDTVIYTMSTPCPSCAVPGGIYYNLLSTTTAILSWNADTTAIGYTVAYGTGTDPDSMTTASTTGTNYTLTGLTPETYYR